MINKVTIKSPAKINLFLHVVSKRKDGFHNIKSGITFINLFDQVSIIRENSLKIEYSGPFCPAEGLYVDCIVKKTLEFLKLKDINLHINITKNIPTQGGLGSASTNAAALIKGLEQMDIIKTCTNYDYYSYLGKDVPVFLFGKNALVSGAGEKVLDHEFPKYFFLIVKPTINLSTKSMYKKINILKNQDKVNNHFRNDFEEIAIKEHDEIKQIINFFKKNKNCVLTSITGSGSCCFGAFKNKEHVNEAMKELKILFPDFWSVIVENNKSD